MAHPGRIGADRAKVMPEWTAPAGTAPRPPAPTRLVGRENEVAALRAVFAGVLTGERRGVLVSGPPGVGKTALLEALRPLVTAHHGWFVTGQFDKYRHDEDTDGLRLAFRCLLRLMLVEPEEELTRIRQRIATVVGGNVRLAAAVLPELGELMRVTPETPDLDSSVVPARLRTAALDLARAVASPRRPIVMVLDDLQRAPAHRLEFVDALMHDESIAGMLVVGGYRGTPIEVEQLSRPRRLGTSPLHIELGNLPPAASTALVADRLRLDEPAAEPLAVAIAERTGGHPYDTIELLNALCRTGVLVPGGEGWRWDLDDVRQAAGRPDVFDRPAARLDDLPADTVEILEVMAGLGREVEIELLATAAAVDRAAIDTRLRPALEEGVLVLRPSDRRVRFGHDRVQQAAFNRLDRSSRAALGLTVARRVAASPGHRTVAAEQYLLAMDALTDAGERHRAAELMRDAARRAQLLADDPLVERFAAAGLELAAEPRGKEPAGLTLELLTLGHSALVGQARFEAADEVFARIAGADASAVAVAPATWAQLNSLQHRHQLAETVTLGLDLLARLGEPFAESSEPVADTLAAFATAGDEVSDRRRSEVDDPRIVAIAGTVTRLINVAFAYDPGIHGWLLTRAAHLWSTYGPTAALMSTLGHAIFVTDAHTGRVITQRIIAVGAARGFEPETAEARSLYASSIGHWFEPLEDNLPRAQAARERLLRGGDPIKAALTYYSTLPNLLDCASTLGGWRPEIEAALELATRIGNQQLHSDFLSFRDFVRAMRGEDDAITETPSTVEPYAYYPTKALAAAILGDVDAMTRLSRAALEQWPLIRFNYLAVHIQLLRALSAAAEARAGGPPTVFAQLDECRDWFAERAADAPDNLRHLLHLVVAERAWASDTPAAAVRAFDAALRDVARVHRPWHRALIAERAAAFHMAYGMRYVGEQLLREAREHYAAWGATAKVADLDRRFPALVRAPRVKEATVGDPGGVLAATRAISAETSVDRLPARVAATLATLTGASEVHVVLRDPDGSQWRVQMTGAPPVPVEEARLPVEALRFVERTGEPLVVNDATQDERFAQDPYLALLDHCALLAVPVPARGNLTAILVLEQRHGPFTAEQVGAVLQVAGQLAVTLDNARLFAALERKVEERDAALAVANERLERLSVTDPLTGLANRRRLADVLDSEWWRAVRPAQSMAIAVVDVDHFSAYNEHYGRLAGDRCLQRIAAAVSECVRTMDLVARYDGEAFAVVLPTVGAEVGQLIAQRIRDAVIALEEPHERSPFGFVTVSVGVVAEVPSWDGSPQALLEEAGHRRTEAKRRGRNLVVAG
jgi:diguanylate cyclase (GGDEF)-like protein